MGQFKIYCILLSVYLDMFQFSYVEHHSREKMSKSWEKIWVVNVRLFDLLW